MSYGWSVAAEQWLREEMTRAPAKLNAVWWENLAARWNAGKPVREQHTGKAFGIRWSYMKRDAVAPFGGSPPFTEGTVKADLEHHGAGIQGANPAHPPALHVKKLHVHVPPAVTPASTNGMLTAVLYGDTHFPFHDESALRVVAQVIRTAQPDVVIHMGDLLDTYHLSRFDHDPKRMKGLQEEVDLARAHLAAFRVLAPKARFIYLEGNHEDRLRRALWSMPPHAQALMALEAVQGVLTWPKLLGLDELDIEFYAYGDQSKREFLPKFLVKHGNVVRKLSGYTARAEMDKYNKSGASGHTHRLGAFFHRDSNGNHIWAETGCTCLLNPEYAQDPDWQQGCVVMTFEPHTGAFQTELVYIHEGSAVFRGKWYDTKEEV